MITIDTNILVRYAVKDDHKQAVAATEFLRNNSCFILKSVLLELAWVLSSQSGYGLSCGQVTERLLHICGLPTITVEDAAVMAQCISWYEQGMDFADALHLASSQSNADFATMDKRLVSKAAKIAPEQKITLLTS